MTEHQNCSEFFERLSDLIDGVLDGKSDAEIEAHLTDCPNCRACYATFRKSVEIFKNLGNEPVPPGFLDQIKAFIHKSQESGAGG